MFSSHFFSVRTGLRRMLIPRYSKQSWFLEEVFTLRRSSQVRGRAARHGSTWLDMADPVWREDKLGVWVGGCPGLPCFFNGFFTTPISFWPIPGQTHLSPRLQDSSADEPKTCWGQGDSLCSDLGPSSLRRAGWGVGGDRMSRSSRWVELSTFLVRPKG